MENVMHLDLHCLITRFVSLRLRDPERLARLIHSIRQHGQLMPVVVVAEAVEPPRWVLIDGYRRLEALRAVGEDLIWVDVWERSVDEALLLCLARGTERGFKAIEEAALLQELSSRYSLRTLALRIGRDVSWVSRRLSLYRALPEELLEAVRAGRVSLWAATRIMVPLARANTEHVRTLLLRLEAHPLSTRELQCLYIHYQQANRTQRERMVEHPELLLKVLQGKEEAIEAKRLAEGLEGAWCHDLAVVRRILGRLVEQVPTLFTGSQAPVERQRLRQAFVAAKTELQRLEHAIDTVPVYDPL